MTEKPKSKAVERNYLHARERFEQVGVDTDKAIDNLQSVSISVHCWQGDDVAGFEAPDSNLGGGLAATGNYPGKARTPDELRADAGKAFSLIPGRHRFNLHAFYANLQGKSVQRNELQPEHFLDWIDWAKEQGLKLDFNPTFFSHPKAEDGFTLSHADPGIRSFWVEHAMACRKIGEAMGQAQQDPCLVNLWIPDGYKDLPADRWSPRERLKSSLDRVFSETLDKSCIKDSLESKLFGIGSESYVVGSHEFYLGYGMAQNIMVCLDMGHFHPTESVADKISSILTFMDEILLHVSRGVRWDSDHVVILNDDLRALTEEIVRGNALSRVHIGLDYFDASLNRVAAWVIGTRSMLKALLCALLQPQDLLKEWEATGDLTGRLALMEETKTLPVGSVWEYHCEKAGVPTGMDWLHEIRDYEKTVLSKR